MLVAVCDGVVLYQEVEFVLAPGQQLYSLKFDVMFTNNIALSYFIGEICTFVYCTLDLMWSLLIHSYYLPLWKNVD